MTELMVNYALPEVTRCFSCSYDMAHDALKVNQETHVVENPLSRRMWCINKECPRYGIQYELPILKVRRVPGSQARAPRLLEGWDSHQVWLSYCPKLEEEPTCTVNEKGEVTFLIGEDTYGFKDKAMIGGEISAEYDGVLFNVRLIRPAGERTMPHSVREPSYE